MDWAQVGTRQGGGGAVGEIGRVGGGKRWHCGRMMLVRHIGSVTRRLNEDMRACGCARMCVCGGGLGCARVNPKP